MQPRWRGPGLSWQIVCISDLMLAIISLVFDLEKTQTSAAACAVSHNDPWFWNYFWKSKTLATDRFQVSHLKQDSIIKLDELKLSKISSKHSQKSSEKWNSPCRKIFKEIFQTIIKNTFLKIAWISHQICPKCLIKVAQTPPKSCPKILSVAYRV